MMEVGFSYQREHTVHISHATPYDKDGSSLLTLSKARRTWRSLPEMVPDTWKAGGMERYDTILLKLGATRRK